MFKFSEPAPQPASPRRRFRDRVIDRDGTTNQSLKGVHAVQNHLLLFDDDIRETAMALVDIEKYLARALTALESNGLTRGEVEALAGDLEVEARLMELDDNLANLKQRLRLIAGGLRK